MSIENRTRVPSGVRTGGQFAAETHAEAGVVLAPPARSATDQAVLSAVGDLARTNANFQLAEWERRLSARQLPWMTETSDEQSDAAAEGINAVQQAKEFENLSREDQEQLLDQVKLSGVKHMLEPGQKLGTDTIQVAEGLSLDNANIAVALAAQAEVHNANLPGTVTMTGNGDIATFRVQEGDVYRDLRIGTAMIAIETEPDDDGYSWTRGTWLWRTRQSLHGGSILEKDRSTSLAAYFDEHRRSAIMMDVIAASPLKGSSDEIGELNLADRTAGVRADGGREYILDVSEDTPVMRTEDGTDLHPSMVAGFLDHVSRQGDHEGGAQAFVKDLREVFDETERRLAS